MSDDAEWPGPVVPGNRWDLAPTGPESAAPVRVGVVVTHFEQPRELARTLAALRAQTHPAGRLRIVVSDDGSATAPAAPAGVRLVRQEDRGFRAAAARNLGAAAAVEDGAEVLVFLDADTTPEPGFVAAITRLPSTLGEAVVVGRRRHADLSGDGRELPEPAWLTDGWARTRHLLGADETSFRFVISAVLACSARMWAEVGGFDETFAAYGGEDWEWAHRAWTHGALLAHEPAAVAWHDGPDHAGRSSAPGEADREADRQRAETLAIGDRIPVPFVAPRGFLGATGDPVVTVDPAVMGTALVLALDSLLAALPRARVLLPGDVVGSLPADPRLVPHDGDPLASAPARSAWRHLHLHRAVDGEPSAWTATGLLLAGPGAPGEVRVLGDDGEVAVTWSTLRAERRARRWTRPDLDPSVEVPGKMRPIDPAVTLAARWGGWA